MEQPTLTEIKKIQQLMARPLTIDDVHALYEFDMLAEYEQNLDTPTDHRPEPIPEEGYREAIEKGDIVNGIFNGERLVAYYRFEPKADKGEMYVSAIMVHPEYRDMGVGSYCLRMADYEAISKGFNKCSLTVDPLNGRGVYSYFKHGYKVVGYDLNHWGPNAHRFLMEKDLFGKTNNFEDERRDVLCSDDLGLVETTSSGFIGTGLVRSLDGDPRKNKIVFQK